MLENSYSLTVDVIDVSPTLTILGCPLWSSLNENDLDILFWSLTDFKRIHGLDPATYNQIHQVDLKWLEDSLEVIRQMEPERRVVVLTHHSPTKDGTGDPKYNDGPTISAFATELSRSSVWGWPVAVWAFGHTHRSCDFVCKGVRVCSNQRGYGAGSHTYDSNKIISL